MTLFSRLIRLNLTAKLTLLIEGLVVVLVIVTGVITTMREKTALETELRKRGLALASDLARFTVRPLLSQDLPTLRRFVNNSMVQDYVRYVVILDPHGKVVMHSDLAEVGKIYIHDQSISAALASGPKVARLLNQGESHCDIFAPIAVSDIHLGAVRLGYSYKAVEAEIANARQQIVIIGLATIMVGGVVAYVLAAFISSPIRKITDATEKVAKGAPFSRVRINGNDEIGILADSFNHMAQDLERYHRHLEQLVEKRTVDLETANMQLSDEVSERKRAEVDLNISRERLRDLASHLQTIREEEARRIAREIHDELGQALTALKMDLHWINSKLAGGLPELPEKTAAMLKLIEATIQSVRRISSELRPGLLDDFGLSAAIEWQLGEFGKRTGLDCHMVSEPEDIVPDQDCSIALYRIFQETLTNIARHAHATRVEVSLEEKLEKVELRVRDNGKGIPENQLSTGKSLGLIGMRERVHHLNGDLMIHSVQNEGTTVTASIPTRNRRKH